MWEAADHHRGKKLEVALNASDKYNPLIFGRWRGDLCTGQDFFDGTMDEAWKIVHDKVPYQQLLNCKQF